MISVTLSKIANILLGEIFGSEVTIKNVATSTNQITKECLFVALKGERFDAHNFAMQAKNRGASALLVNRRVNIDLPQILVKDTRFSFGKLASWIRQQVPAKIVALTGSSGKTSVKEMTAAILRQCGNTLCTEGNLNNDLGVSMTLVGLTRKHDSAVIELGASHQGEIAWSTYLSRPNVALVNNIAVSHLKGFGSLENIAKEKGEIYSGLSSNGIAVINADSNDFPNWKNIIGSRKIWTFSLNAINSDFTAKNIRIISRGITFILQTPIGNIDILLPLIGYHNVSNALAASALSAAVGAPLTAIKNGLAEFMMLHGRMFPIQLAENQLLLDDSYNSNVGSMIAAIQTLSKMNGYRVMVVGDMAELGDYSKLYHAKIGMMVKAFAIDHVLSIGNFSRIIARESGVGECFSDKITLIQRLKTLMKEKKNITILVKGSRNANMEEIVQMLQNKKGRIC